MTGLAIGTSDDEADESDLLDEFANEAVLDILSRTRVNVRHGQVTLDQGDLEFDIDLSILNIYKLERGDVTLTANDAVNDLGANDYSFVGFNRLVLGTAGANDLAYLWYTPLPTPMTLDAHDPSAAAYGNIPTQFHRAIVDYMCWHASDKARDQSAARGEKYRILYEGQDGMGGPGSDLGRIKLATNIRGGATRVKSPRRRLASETDSKYWIG